MIPLPREIRVPEGKPASQWKLVQWSYLKAWNHSAGQLAQHGLLKVIYTVCIYKETVARLLCSFPLCLIKAFCIRVYFSCFALLFSSNLNVSPSLPASPQIPWWAQWSLKWQEMMWTQALLSLTHSTWKQTVRECLGFIVLEEVYRWLALWTMKRGRGTLWQSDHLTLSIKARPTSQSWWMMWTITHLFLLKTCTR